MKNLIDVMKKVTEQFFDGVQFELLSIQAGSSREKDTEREIPFVRLEVEVPRDLKPYGRCRFNVKVPNGKVIVTQEQLEEDDDIYVVYFENLVISYIDSNNNVYFKADSYDVMKGSE